MKHVRMIATLSLVTLLAACGNTQGDRALSGAGIGAGVGTVGSVILGANPVAGAVVGGAAGAVTGAITQKDDINLGKPLWR